MSRKTLIQEHEKLMQRYNRAEGQRERNYKGYEKGVYLREYGLTQDVLSINDTDTTKQIREKNEQLKEMFTGTQKMLVVQGATKQNRFIPLKRWQEGDRIQSQINYENYKLQMAGVNAVEMVRRKNEKGEYEYEKVNYDVVGGAGLDLPDIGLVSSRLMFAMLKDRNGKVYQRILGAQVPNRLSEGERIRYEEWLLNRAQVTLKEIKGSKQTSSYPTLFKGVSKVNKNKRLTTYQHSIVKALTGKNSIIKIKDNKKVDYNTLEPKIKRIARRISRMTEKEFLYMSFKYSDLLTFDYVYSPEEFESRIDGVDTTIKSFQKSLKDKNSVEYEQYQKFLKELGTYYD